MLRDFTDAGIVSVVNDEHSEKQESGRDVTDAGIISVNNDKH
jgi:hypothetical protein